MCRVFVCWMLFCVAGYSVAGSLPYDDLSAARKYVESEVAIVHFEDISWKGRARAEVWVYASVSTFDERVKVALESARAVSDHGFNYVKVYLLHSLSEALVGTGSYTAVAEYSPTCRDYYNKSKLKHCTWSVKALNGVQDAQKDTIEVLWHTHRRQFLSVANGLDESGLKRHIAGLLGEGVSVGSVVLPHYAMFLKEL